MGKSTINGHVQQFFVCLPEGDIHFNGIFHYKPTILGYHHLWKPPCRTCLRNHHNEPVISSIPFHSSRIYLKFLTLKNSQSSLAKISIARKLQSSTATSSTLAPQAGFMCTYTNKWLSNTSRAGPCRGKIDFCLKLMALNLSKET